MTDDAPLTPPRLVAVYFAGPPPEVRIWSSQTKWVIAVECRDEQIAHDLMADLRYFIRSRKDVDAQWDAIRRRIAQVAQKVEGGDG